MADVSVKMGVSGISQFKSAMTQAQASVKTLDAQLKSNEAQLKATGDAEVYMANKLGLLQKQLKEQKNVVANASKALAEMKDRGLDSSNKEFQKMEQTLANATGKMFDIQAQIKDVGKESETAAKSAGNLSTELGGISKKMSLDQVISGIDKITGGLEAAAKKAVEVGQAIWDDVKTAAKWADDSATMAEMYEIPLERYLQMEALYKSGMDTSTDAILSSMSKMKKSVGKESKETMEYLTQLGLMTAGTIDTGFGKVEATQKLLYNADELFFKAGKALMNMSDAYDKEAAAQAIFGKSWKELVPLFNRYGSLEEYNAALESMTVNSDDAVTKMAELNDRLMELENAWNTAKFELLSTLAEPLKGAAEALTGVLTSVTDYLKTPEGKKALDDLSTAVSGLFEDLSSIDPEKVVEGFTTVFGNVVKGFQWIVENVDTVKGILKGIVTAWGAAKLFGGALDVLNLINGIRGLTGAGAAAAASAAGKTAGAAWGAGFAKAVVAAAPWLIGVYTLLNPAETGDDGFRPEVDETGAATQYGMEKLKSMYANPNLTEEQKGMTQWDPAWNAVPFVADVFGQMSDILNDPMAAGAILRFSDDMTGLVEALEGLGYEKNMTEDQYSEYMRTKREEAVAAEEASGSVDTLSEQAEIAAGSEQTLSENAEIAAAALAQAAAAAATLSSAAARSRMSFPFYGTGMNEREYANGIPYVPFDGWVSILHRGEKVVPAREVGSSRNFSSNLYVESMYMNNGTDAEGLAAAMAAAQKRTMSGYGS